MYFEQLKKEAENVWWSRTTTAIKFKHNHTKVKDQALSNLCMRLVNKAKSNETMAQEDFDAFMTFAQDHLAISQETSNLLYDDQYLALSQAFVAQAKALDESLSWQDIFQALRNVWTMFTMQVYMHKPLALSPSVFAYSMLYPLTDNLLDAADLSKAQKFDFNKRFRLKIKTGTAQALNDQEEKIFAMIDLIEKDWDRTGYPKVYQALLAILDGQNMSLHQQGNKNIFAKDILGISFYKGGTSVLADAYLIGGHLSPDQERFAYYYGLILQLADDLQDIKEDLAINHMTLMNIQSRLGSLDGLVHQYFNLIDYFFKDIFKSTSPKQEAIGEVIRESLQALILAALMKQKKHLSKALYKTLKNQSHFSPRAFKKAEKMFYDSLKLGHNNDR